MLTSDEAGFPCSRGISPPLDYLARRYRAKQDWRGSNRRIVARGEVFPIQDLPGRWWYTTPSTSSVNDLPPFLLSLSLLHAEGSSSRNRFFSSLSSRENGDEPFDREEKKTARGGARKKEAYEIGKSGPNRLGGTPPRHPHSDEREAILPLVQGKIG